MSSTFESKGRRASTLGAPNATVLAPASQETTAKSGIVEWRIYRSKTDLIMRGYNVSGRAMKGISTSFATADGEQNVVATSSDPDAAEFEL